MIGVDKISYRELQRMPAEQLLSILPCGVTVDSQGAIILLSVEGYRRLVERYKHDDSQATPPYNPVLHPPGTHVLIKQGKRLVEAVVPELDADGQPIPL